MIVVEIVFAEAQRAVLKTLALPQGATVAEAMRLATREADFDDVNLTGAAVGIFGRHAQADQVLCDGDRLEIYRPLVEDPKTARRRRAERNQ